MAGDDVFTAYDSVTGQTCGPTVNTYVRKEPSAKTKADAEAGRSGSGFLLSQTAFVLTCNHVIEGGSRITVHFPSGAVFEASVAARDPNNDIAVLSLKGFSPGQDGFHMTLEANALAGDFVHVIGYPLGSESASIQVSFRGKSARRLGLKIPRPNFG